MSASLRPDADAVVVLDRELDRRHPAEVRVVQRRPRAGLHARGLAGDARDRVDRMAEQVAVVELRVAAERAHAVAQLRLDERVDDHRRAALHPLDRQLQVGDRLDARMPDLEELLVGELRLQRLHEPLRGLAGRVRDHVQLDGVHQRHLNGLLMRLLGMPGTLCAREAPARRGGGRAGAPGVCPGLGRLVSDGRQLRHVRPDPGVGHLSGRPGAAPGLGDLPRHARARAGARPLDAEPDPALRRPGDLRLAGACLLRPVAADDLRVARGPARRAAGEGDRHTRVRPPHREQQQRRTVGGARLRHEALVVLREHLRQGGRGDGVAGRRRLALLPELRRGLRRVLPRAQPAEARPDGHRLDDRRPELLPRRDRADAARAGHHDSLGGADRLQAARLVRHRRRAHVHGADAARRLVQRAPGLSDEGEDAARALQRLDARAARRERALPRSAASAL